LANFGNLFMSWVLRSPFHRLLSENVLLITVTGRKSGREYTLPVNYQRAGNEIWITSQRERTWWRNLRGGSAVELRLAGKTVRGRGEVFEDDMRVAEYLMRFLQRSPSLARYFGVGLDSEGKLRGEDVARAAVERVMVRVKI
jgi:deazaflavin-dependent oxidoreductase (nitroreductase family)